MPKTGCGNGHNASLSRSTLRLGGGYAAKILLVIFILLFGILGVQAAPVQQACEGYTTVLSAGMEAQVSPGPPNNVRSLPSINAGRVGQIPGGGVFTILDGPRCADGLTWWQVNYNGLEGWTAEGSDNEHWLEPAAGRGGAPSVVPVNPTNTNTPALLEGMAFSAGGGGGESAGLCDLPDELRPANGILSGMVYVPSEGVENYGPFSGEELRFDSGNTIIFNSLPSGGHLLSALQDYLPAICVFAALRGSETYGIAPDGQRTQGIETLFTRGLHVDASDNVFVVQLPLEAYRQPGMWQIGIEGRVNFSLRVLVPEAPQPFFLSDENHTLVGGFQPNERVVGVRVTDLGPWFRFDFSVDADGYALLEFPNDSCELNCVFVGSNGSVVPSGFGTVTNLEVNRAGTTYGMSYETQPPPFLNERMQTRLAAGESIETILFDAFWG